ncbi:hypothetical protein INF37_11915 [Pseudoflavonifractor sp. DSM 107456]|uniref:Lipoprotein n=1 Tax=Pseudoflavonifractor gallinarum TaxID=2779352 RepID=A0ABR9RDB8_9FIRM|nr:hypothetical protein [Pseudoflavonifractor gallinarum]MBE5056692.1 hypothetical protein [Pseudoflavonifractor gallinarum]
MKRIFCILALTLVIGMGLAGCSGTEPMSSPTPTPTMAPTNSDHPVQDAIDGAGDAAKGVLDGAGDVVRGAADGVGNAARDVGDGIKNAVQ